nr:MAG: hypothetical protein TU36_05850 [Vulcanisaeta sp. AZ3]
MQINKPFTLILIFMVIVIIASPRAAFGNYYVGFYNVINWPVLSVSIVNGTSTNDGIIIVISPSIQVTQYTVFSGIALIGNEYLLVNGIIYSNGTIYITSTTPVNTTVSTNTNSVFNTTQPIVNTTYGGFEYIVEGKHIYRAGQIRIPPINSSRIRNITSNVVIRNVTSSVVVHEASAPREPVVLMRIPIYVSLFATISIIALFMLIPAIRFYVGDNKECINEAFIKLIKKLGLKDPSLTHRDIGNYLKDHLIGVDEDLIDRLINYYETTIYGNGNVKCEEFKSLIRQLVRESVRRRGG